MDLQGRTALVTGGGRGIGRAIALAYARHGARVAVCARTGPQVQGVAAECRALGAEAVAVEGDVRDEMEVRRIVDAVREHLGPIDVLVNNAGAFWTAKVLDTRIPEIEEMLRLNVIAPVAFVQAVLPSMLERDQGVIINIGSLAGRKGYVKQSAYCASKHALLGFTKSLALEVADTGIRVTMLSPGGVDTDLIAAARPDLDRRTWMDPDDLASAAVSVTTLPEKMAIDEVVIRRRASEPGFV